jgi:hypothetical protein
VSGGDGPLSLHLLLEGTVITETRETIEERLLASLIVRTLQYAQCFIEPLSWFQDSMREPGAEMLRCRGASRS